MKWSFEQYCYWCGKKITNPKEFKKHGISKGKCTDMSGIKHNTPFYDQIFTGKLISK